MSTPVDIGNESGRLAIGFFGHDSGESTVIKRATAFMAHGASVTGFMFHRIRRRSPPPPAWLNFDLGVTHDRNYLRRLPQLVRGVFKAVRHHATLRQQHVLYARNVDMLFIAVAVNIIARTRALIVYEALDVQPIFVGQRLINRLFRWAERRLLAACDLVVVSSPYHMSEYFHSLQSYTGPWCLLENKVGAHPVPAGSAAVQSRLPSGPPWVIGFFGVLRCGRSLEILRRTAEALPRDVVVHLRGQASETDVPHRKLEELAASHPNILFEGAYANPHDLADIYGKVHFAWAIDYIAAQSNSKWSLLNRFYEGGLFGAVALAREGTATGGLVTQTGFGWVLPEPVDNSLIELLRGLKPADYARVRRAQTEAPRSMFIDETDTRDLIRALETRGRTKRRLFDRSDVRLESKS